MPIYKSRPNYKCTSFTQLLLDRQTDTLIKKHNNTHREYYSTIDRLNCLKASRYFYNNRFIY